MDGISRLKLFWLSYLLSSTALGVYLVAFNWLTVKNYGALGISLITFGYAAPQIILVLFGGLASDSINKQTLYRVCQILFFISGLTLVLISLNTIPPLWLLVTLSIGSGSIAAFSTPAQISLVSELVASDQVAKIQQYFYFAAGLGWVFGSIIAAHVLPIHFFLINNAHGSLAFLIYTVCLIPLILFVPKSTATAAPAAQVISRKSKVLLVFSDIRKSLFYLRTTTDIRTLMRTLALLMVFGTPFVVLLSIYAHDHPSIHQSSKLFSHLYAAVGVGRLSGSLLGIYFTDYSKQQASFFVYFIFGLCLAALAALVVPEYWEITLSIILIGLFSNVCTNLLRGLIQSQTEPDMRGRIAGFTQLLSGASSLSAGGAGYLIHHLSDSEMNVYTAFEYVQASMFIMLALLTLANLPSIRRVRIRL